MKTKATIKMEFIAGTTIENAFEEAIRIATILGVWCQFDANGVTCLADSSGKVKKGVEEYKDQIKSEASYKIACA